MNEYDLDIFRLAGEGYCCSQIIIQMALEVQGVENPGLIRAFSGLCHGFPATKGSCGAITGAACLIGYFGGKGHSAEDENERLPLMLSELSDWFEEFAASRFTGIRCADIVDTGTPDSSICTNLIAECYGKAMTILIENGFDPGTPNDE